MIKEKDHSGYGCWNTQQQYHQTCFFSTCSAAPVLGDSLTCCCALLVSWLKEGFNTFLLLAVRIE